jgi:hypothetical protein
MPLSGGVLELADKRDLGSRAARRAGSNPAFPILNLDILRSTRSLKPKPPVKTASLAARTLTYLGLPRPEKLIDPQTQLIHQVCQQITQVVQAFAHILRTYQVN